MKVKYWITILILFLIGVGLVFYNYTWVQDKPCLDIIGGEYCRSQNLTYDGIWGFGKSDIEMKCINNLDWNKRESNYPPTKYFKFLEGEKDKCYYKFKDRNKR